MGKAVEAQAIPALQKIQRVSIIQTVYMSYLISFGSISWGFQDNLCRFCFRHKFLMHIGVFLLQKKDKAQKRQQREQRLVESLRNLAIPRSCRIRRPVNYTCGIYEFVLLINVFWFWSLWVVTFAILGNFIFEKEIKFPRIAIVMFPV